MNLFIMSKNEWLLIKHTLLLQHYCNNFNLKYIFKSAIEVPCCYHVFLQCTGRSLHIDLTVSPGFYVLGTASEQQFERKCLKHYYIM